jgi:hypothetical protein
LLVQQAKVLPPINRLWPHCFNFAALHACSAAAGAAEISNDLLDVYVTVLAKDSAPGTPPAAQPSSPDDNTHLQLQENRVRLVMQQQQQQQHARQQQQQRLGGPTTPSEEQQQQQGEEPQQQPNGSLQHHPS